MRRIHKVEYSRIFGTDFQVNQIDQGLSDLQLDQQLKLLDNVIDYVYVNFRSLSANAFSKKHTLSEALKIRQAKRQEARKQLLDTIGFHIPKPKPGIDAGTGQLDGKIDLMNMTDQEKKLVRKGALPSLSLSYKKAQVSLTTKISKARTIKMDLPKEEVSEEPNAE
jgi:hypothetical protein